MNNWQHFSPSMTGCHSLIVLIMFSDKHKYFIVIYSIGQGLLLCLMFWNSSQIFSVQNQ